MIRPEPRTLDELLRELTFERFAPRQAPPPETSVVYADVYADLLADTEKQAQERRRRVLCEAVDGVYQEDDNVIPLNGNVPHECRDRQAVALLAVPDARSRCRPEHSVRGAGDALPEQAHGQKARAGVAGGQGKEGRMNGLGVSGGAAALLDRPATPARQGGGRVVEAPLDVRLDVRRASRIADHLGICSPRLRVDPHAAHVALGSHADRVRLYAPTGQQTDLRVLSRGSNGPTVGPTNCPCPPGDPNG